MWVLLKLCMLLLAVLTECNRPSAYIGISVQFSLGYFTSLSVPPHRQLIAKVTSEAFRSALSLLGDCIKSNGAAEIDC